MKIQEALRSTEAADQLLINIPTSWRRGLVFVGLESEGLHGLHGLRNP